MILPIIAKLALANQTSIFTEMTPSGQATELSIP